MLATDQHVSNKDSGHELKYEIYMVIKCGCYPHLRKIERIVELSKTLFAYFNKALFLSRQFNTTVMIL